MSIVFEMMALVGGVFIYLTLEGSKSHLDVIRSTLLSQHAQFESLNEKMRDFIGLPQVVVDMKRTIEKLSKELDKDEKYRFAHQVDHNLTRISDDLSTQSFELKLKLERLQASIDHIEEYLSNIRVNTSRTSQRDQSL